VGIFQEMHLESSRFSMENFLVNFWGFLGVWRAFYELLYKKYDGKFAGKSNLKNQKSGKILNFSKILKCPTKKSTLKSSNKSKRSGRLN
jgi:hypothetical protein